MYVLEYDCSESLRPPVTSTRPSRSATATNPDRGLPRPATIRTSPDAGSQIPERLSVGEPSRSRPDAMSRTRLSARGTASASRRATGTVPAGSHRAGAAGGGGVDGSPGDEVGMVADGAPEVTGVVAPLAAGDGVGAAPAHAASSTVIASTTARVARPLARG